MHYKFCFGPNFFSDLKFLAQYILDSKLFQSKFNLSNTSFSGREIFWTQNILPLISWSLYLFWRHIMKIKVIWNIVLASKI